MLHLTSAFNLMEDATRVKYSNDSKKVKAGKVNLPKKIFYEKGTKSFPCGRLRVLSKDTTRWARRLIKTGEYKSE